MLAARGFCQEDSGSWTLTRKGNDLLYNKAGRPNGGGAVDGWSGKGISSSPQESRLIELMNIRKAQGWSDPVDAMLDIAYESGKCEEFLLPCGLAPPDHADHAKRRPRMQLPGNDLTVLQDFGPDIERGQERETHTHSDHLAKRVQTCAFVVKRQIGAKLLAQIAHLVVQAVAGFESEDSLSLEVRSCRVLLCG